MAIYQFKKYDRLNTTLVKVIMKQSMFVLGDGGWFNRLITFLAKNYQSIPSSAFVCSIVHAAFSTYRQKEFCTHGTAGLWGGFLIKVTVGVGNVELSNHRK